MAEAVHKTGNVVLIDKYAQKTALRLGVTPDAVRAEFRRFQRGAPRGMDTTEGTADQESAPTPPSAQEGWLLKLILLHDPAVDWVANNLDPAWIQHPLVREIIEKRLDAHRANTWQNLGAFLGQWDAPEMHDLITEAAAETRTIPNPTQQLCDLTLRLRNQFIDRQLHELIVQSEQPETDDTTRLSLLRQQQKIRELKRQPLETRLKDEG